MENDEMERYKRKNDPKNSREDVVLIPTTKGFTPYQMDGGGSPEKELLSAHYELFAFKIGMEYAFGLRKN